MSNACDSHESSGLSAALIPPCAAFEWERTGWILLMMPTVTPCSAAARAALWPASAAGQPGGRYRLPAAEAVGQWLARPDEPLLVVRGAETLIGLRVDEVVGPVLDDRDEPIDLATVLSRLQEE